MKHWLRIAVLIIFVSIGIIFRENQKGEEILPTKTEVVEEKKEIIGRVAVMADIHDDLETLEKSLKKVKESGVEMVILAGDLTINGEEKELLGVKKVLDNSGLEYLVTSGNHDLYKGKYDEVFNNGYFSGKYGEIKIILIDNSNWRGLGDGQKTWIEGEVKDCLMVKCLVVMHKPLGHYLTKHVMGENSEKVTAEAEWLNDKLLDNKVNQIYVGHLHFNSVYTYLGMETTVVGAISKQRNNQTPRYLELGWNGDEFISKVVVLD